MKQEFQLVTKSQFLLWTLLASIFFRFFVIYFFLPSSSTSWAADEGTYARLSIYLADGNPPEKFPIYGSKLYYSSRSFIQPCVLLIQLGMDSIVSVRLVSTFYAVAGIIALIFIYARFVLHNNPQLQSIDELLNWKTKLLFLAYAFLPSYFLWTVLGLKESTSQFWVLASFYALFKLYDKTAKNRTFFFIFIASLTFAFGARPQTAYAFSLTAFGFGLFVLLKNKEILILGAAVVGLLSGILFSNTATKIGTIDPKPSRSEASIDPKPSRSEASIDPKPSRSEASIDPKPSRSEADISLSPKDSVVTLAQQELQLAINSLMGLIRTINEKSRENAVGAASEFSPDNCPLLIRSFEDIICTVSKVPYRTFSFLLKPMPFADQGSLSLIWASYENILWILFFTLLIVLLFKSKFELFRFNPFMGFLLGYIFIFVVSAALYEGNIGTAFRHKSTILWPLILLLLMANSRKTRF